MTDTVSSDSAGVYVYGIVPADIALPNNVVGIEGKDVIVLDADDAVAALVTDMESGDEYGTPDGLLAHSTVLDTIASTSAVLPMTFGTVLPSREDLVERVLAPRSEDLSRALAEIDGAVQFTVRARYIRDAALSTMVEENPEIARLRDRIAGTTEDETRPERIRLGELIVNTFDRMRPGHMQRIVDAVSPYARGVSSRDLGGADDVVDLALLIPKDQQLGFEDALEDVARELHEGINVRLIGPQAPYDFVKGEQ